MQGTLKRCGGERKEGILELEQSATVDFLKIIVYRCSTLLMNPLGEGFIVDDNSSLVGLRFFIR